MSYRYTVCESTEQEIKRIIEERFNRSVKEFKEPDENIDRADHQMRKNMKKVRGALRLVRGAIGKKKYKKWNVAARDTARKGEELRESKVAIDTLGEIKNRFDWKSDYQFYQIARAKLRRDHQKYKKELLEEHDFQNEIIEKLVDVKEEFNDLSFNKKGFNSFEKGLKKVYKRGRKASKKCKKKSTAENHHEWRKCVKYLWYHIRILKDIWPEELKGYSKELHKLSDYLGDDHDLCDLKSRLNAIYQDSEYTEDLTKTNALIDKFSEEIRTQSWTLGEKIYAEKPKNFTKRIKKYWIAAHKDITDD